MFSGSERSRSDESRRRAAAIMSFAIAPIEITTWIMKTFKPLLLATSALLLASCGTDPTDTSPPEAGREATAVSQPNPALVSTAWIVGDSKRQTILILEAARTAEERAIGLSKRAEKTGDGMALIGTNKFAPFSISEVPRPLQIVTVSQDGKVTSITQHSAGSTTQVSPPSGTIAVLLLEDGLPGSDMIRTGVNAYLAPSTPPS